MVQCNAECNCKCSVSFDNFSLEDGGKQSFDMNKGSVYQRCQGDLGSKYLSFCLPVCLSVTLAEWLAGSLPD